MGFEETPGRLDGQAGSGDRNRGMIRSEEAVISGSAAEAQSGVVVGLMVTIIITTPAGCCTLLGPFR